MPADGRPGRPNRYCGVRCKADARAARSAERAPTEFAPLLTQAIHDSGYSLREIAWRLEELACFISPATLSTWQRGLTAPAHSGHTAQVVLALEQVLDVPAGDLLAAISARQSGDDYSTALNRLRTDIIAGLRRTAAYDDRDRLVVEVGHAYDVGADRRPRREEVTVRLRALADGLSSYWISYSADKRTTAEAVAVAGARLGRVVEESHPRVAEKVVVAELVLDRPLRRGDSTSLSYAVSPTYVGAGVALPAPYLRHVTSEPGCRRLDLRVTFACPPRALTRCDWPPGSREPDAESLVPERIDGDRSWRFDVTRPKRGRSYGWTWRWPAADEAL
jgi:transcriptional regulator with XRE-family HTH domain